MTTKEQRKRRMNVQLVAEAVNLVCPHCAAEVPDPDNGSLFWTVEQVRQETGKESDCDSCENPIRISMTRSVRFE